MSSKSTQLIVNVKKLSNILNLISWKKNKLIFDLSDNCDK